MPEPKHRKEKSCPICYPERVKVEAVIRYRQTGGYSPPRRCAAHQMKFPKPPTGPGAVTVRAS